eukprot:10631974-Alexandrium_andersonii.AAC.1
MAWRAPCPTCRNTRARSAPKTPSPFSTPDFAKNSKNHTSKAPLPAQALHRWQRGLVRNPSLDACALRKHPGMGCAGGRPATNESWGT